MTERCPWCQNSLYHSYDPDHGLIAVKCWSGHLVRYEAGRESLPVQPARTYPRPSLTTS